MKIKNTIKKQSKLLKLKLIKTRIYKKKNTFTNLKVEDIEYRLQKALQIIYKYHGSGKKILFVGNSSSVERIIKELLKNTNHMFIPEYLWLNGVITNKQPSYANLPTKNFYSKILNLRNSLLVVLDHQVNNDIVVENSKAKIPIVFLGSSLNIFDIKPSYKIPGNFLLAKKKLRDNFFLTLLENVLKKATIRKYSKKTLKTYKKNNKKKLENNII